MEYFFIRIANFVKVGSIMLLGYDVNFCYFPYCSLTLINEGNKCNLPDFLQNRFSENNTRSFRAVPCVIIFCKVSWNWYHFANLIIVYQPPCLLSLIFILVFVLIVSYNHVNCCLLPYVCKFKQYGIIFVDIPHK